MRPLLNKSLTVVLCLNLLACSTLHDLSVRAPADRPDVGAPVLAKQLQAGDKLVVSTLQTLRRVLTVTAVQPDALLAIDEADQSAVRLPYADIVSVQRQQVDALRTGLLVLGVALLLAVVGQGLAANKLVNSTAAAGM